MQILNLCSSCNPSSFANRTHASHLNQHTILSDAAAVSSALHYEGCGLTPEGGNTHKSLAWRHVVGVEGGEWEEVGGCVAVRRRLSSSEGKT